MVDYPLFVVEKWTTNFYRDSEPSFTH